ncbi:CPBP family glutamic-type intramembrane protease [Methanobacterium alcaliphilum]|uniref:CPBP family glutamic-type intramembrane protease n=1 Tax=Methanobacterium alcaliphilum TaxID=392018 RepID=UPI003CCBA2B4
MYFNYFKHHKMVCNFSCSPGRPSKLRLLFIVHLVFIMTWITLKSGSVWVAVILHASDNFIHSKYFCSINWSN